MRPKADKFYRVRNGQIAYVAAVAPAYLNVGHDREVIGWLVHSYPMPLMSWNAYGSYLEEGDHENDLIEEVEFNNMKPN